MPTSRPPIEIAMAQLDAATGRRLLRYARSVIERHIAGDSRHGDTEPWPELPPAGVFITLRKLDRLRGCIGTFTPGEDLLKTIEESALAATRDPRFETTPIGANELSDLRIELSVLSPRKRIEDPLNFEAGRHGIYIKNGFASGCFLPDVGREMGWDKERYLSELCRQKAGLSPNAWRDPKTEVYIFTVQKFSE